MTARHRRRFGIRLNRRSRSLSGNRLKINYVHQRVRVKILPDLAPESHEANRFLIDEFDSKLR